MNPSSLGEFEELVLLTVGVEVDDDIPRLVVETLPGVERADEVQRSLAADGAHQGVGPRIAPAGVDVLQLHLQSPDFAFEKGGASGHGKIAKRWIHGCHNIILLHFWMLQFVRGIDRAGRNCV